MEFTTRQTIAITNPCAMPSETLADRFKRGRWVTPTRFISTILSVNK